MRGEIPQTQGVPEKVCLKVSLSLSVKSSHQYRPDQTSPPASLQDYYETLGVARSSTEKEIKTAFRKRT